MNQLKSLIFNIVLLFTFLLSAQDQIEAAVTNRKGSLQMESFTSLGFFKDDYQVTTQLVAPNFLFRYGLAQGVELQLSNQYEIRRERLTDQKFNGKGDLVIGNKFQLFQKEESSFSVGFLPSLIIPIGSTGFTNDKLGFTMALLASHDIHSNVSLGYNIGYNNFDAGKGDLSYAIALNLNIGNKIGLYIEPYGELMEFEEHLISFDTGLNYFFNGSSQLDFSYGQGISTKTKYALIRYSCIILEGHK